MNENMERTINNENISFIESRLSSDTDNHVLLDELKMLSLEECDEKNHKIRE